MKGPERPCNIKPQQKSSRNVLPRPVEPAPEWVDSAIPAAGAGRRLFQHLSPATPSDAVHPARHRRPISALGTERAEKRNIPIVEAPKGRRDEFVDPYFERAKPDAIVVILKAREPARIMTAIGDKIANRWHLQFAQRWVGIGDGCSCASARTCHSPPVFASTSTIGWPTACASKASDSSKPPTPS